MTQKPRHDAEQSREVRDRRWWCGPRVVLTGVGSAKCGSFGLWTGYATESAETFSSSDSPFSVRGCRRSA